MQVKRPGNQSCANCNNRGGCEEERVVSWCNDWKKIPKGCISVIGPDGTGGFVLDRKTSNLVRKAAMKMHIKIPEVLDQALRDFLDKAEKERGQRDWTKIWERGNKPTTRKQPKVMCSK